MDGVLWLFEYYGYCGWHVGNIIHNIYWICAVVFLFAINKTGYSTNAKWLLGVCDRIGSRVPVG
ncbi:MAG: hypothetical protein IKY87_01770, partial [Paludibacteraceae bacterium]|nr:hypothetical protein [Paludibacteraceae bacterium]